MKKMPDTVVHERMRKLGMPVNVWILLTMLLIVIVSVIAAFIFPAETQAVLAVRGVKESAILVVSIAGFVAIFL